MNSPLTSPYQIVGGNTAILSSMSPAELCEIILQATTGAENREGYRSFKTLNHHRPEGVKS